MCRQSSDGGLSDLCSIKRKKTERCIVFLDRLDVSTDVRHKSSNVHLLIALCPGLYVLCHSCYSFDFQMIFHLVLLLRHPLLPEKKVDNNGWRLPEERGNPYSVPLGLGPPRSEQQTHTTRLEITLSTRWRISHRHLYSFDKRQEIIIQ